MTQKNVVELFLIFEYTSQLLNIYIILGDATGNAFCSCFHILFIIDTVIFPFKLSETVNFMYIYSNIMAKSFRFNKTRWST